jgi:predicted glycosyltransferase
MRILIDIGHPAHVHFFKNFYWEMKKRGHDTIVFATQKDITIDLVNDPAPRAQGVLVRGY